MQEKGPQQLLTEREERVRPKVESTTTVAFLNVKIRLYRGHVPPEANQIADKAKVTRCSLGVVYCRSGSGCSKASWITLPNR